jgi:hypothetical protein
MRRLLSSSRGVTENGDGTLRAVAGDEAHARIQRLLVTGDNRLARESYEQALAVAREAGIEDAVRPLVELRLADLDRLARE